MGSPHTMWRPWYNCIGPGARVRCSRTHAHLRLKNGTFESVNDGVILSFITSRGPHQYSWSAVAGGDSWGETEAQVACRMLGYKTVVRAYSTYLEDHRIPILVSEINCTGDETDLLSCPHKFSRRTALNNCPDKNYNKGCSNGNCHEDCPDNSPENCPILVAAVSCDNYNYASSLRLVGGCGPHEGRVEISDNTHKWGTVCDEGWDITDATIACRQLGYARAVRAVTGSEEFGEGTGPIWLSGVECAGLEKSLDECRQGQWWRNPNWGVYLDCSDHSRDAGVECADYTRTVSLQQTSVSTAVPTITEIQPTPTELTSLSTETHLLVTPTKLYPTSSEIHMGPSTPSQSYTLSLHTAVDTAQHISSSLHLLPSTTTETTGQPIQLPSTTSISLHPSPYSNSLTQSQQSSMLPSSYSHVLSSVSMSLVTTNPSPQIIMSTTSSSKVIEPTPTVTRTSKSSHATSIHYTCTCGTFMIMSLYVTLLYFFVVVY